jgi:hypothetical protein
MKLAKNKICNAVNRVAQLQESVNRDTEQLKSDMLSDFLNSLYTDRIKIHNKSIADITEGINSYKMDYPEENCSCKCVGCPLSQS